MLKKPAGSVLSPTFPDWVIVTTQIMAYVITVIPLRLRYRAVKKLPRSLRSLRQGSLIIANHQSMVDPFFITFSLPFRTYIKILPIRFPTADHIFTNGWYNPKFFPLLSMLGCFTIGTTSAEGMRSIFYIRDVLKKRQTVFLFPEGGITTEENVKQLKQGVDFFMKDALNVMFVRLRGFNVSGKAGLSYRINFGEIFEPPPTMNTTEMREYLERL